MILVLALEPLEKGSPLSEMGTVQEEEVWCESGNRPELDIAV